MIGYVGLVALLCLLMTSIVESKKRCSVALSKAVNDKCALEQLSVLRSILKNDVPQMNPFIGTQMYISRTFPMIDVTCTCSTYKVEGLYDYRIKGLIVDPKKHMAVIKVRSPKITIHANYKLKGSLFMVPMNNAGYGILTLYDVDIMGRAKVKEVIDKFGKRRFKVETFKLDVTAERGQAELRAKPQYANNAKAVESAFNTFNKQILKIGSPILSDKVTDIYRIMADKALEKYSLD